MTSILSIIIVYIMVIIAELITISLLLSLTFNVQCNFYDNDD